MSVCLLLIDDGREDYLPRCLLSLGSAIDEDFDQIVHVDDTAHELGFAGAIQAGWEQVDTEYVFHVESDFIFNAHIPLGRMRAVLSPNTHLAQLALKRQPWNESERAAGGIVEQHPDDYTERNGHGGLVWTEHRKFFTTNPSLYRAEMCRRGWPQREHSEGHFGLGLVEDGYSFAFWGGKFDPPMVEHVGAVRAGAGY